MSIDFIPIYLTLLRLLAPLLILKFPLPGVLLSIFLDMSDWDLINFQTDQDYIIYQSWDKALDLYFLSLAAITVFTWKNRLAKKISISLYLYRGLGVILFFLTSNRGLLFFFPNFLEVFFVFFLLVPLFTKKATLTFTSILLLTVPKVIHEFFVHLLLKQPWEIIKFTNVESSDKLIWFTLLYILPISVALYLAKTSKKGWKIHP